MLGIPGFWKLKLKVLQLEPWEFQDSRSSNEMKGFRRLDSPGGRFLLEGLDVRELHGLAPTPGLENVPLEWEKDKEKWDWDRNDTGIHPRIPAQISSSHFTANGLFPFSTGK